MNKYSEYMPENSAEELFELVGRIKAFSAYVNSAKYSIEREICASMLGFELEEGKENVKDNCSAGNTELD